MSSDMRRRERRAAWLFLLPAIIALAVVAGWPLLRTIMMSFTDATFTRPGAAEFVGFRNYLDIFADRVWWRAVSNTAIFTLASVSIETVLGLMIALLLHQAIPGRGLLRASILIPWAMPAVVSAKIWEWMLHDQYGVINKALVGMGLISQGIAWIAEPHLALWVIVFVDVWITTPFMVLLILAGLQMIPEDIMEAAYVDGIPAWRRLLYITLPLLRPAIGVAILFRTLDAVRMFDLSFMLAGNSQRTMTISVYARNQLVSFQQMGMGSAASTWVFFLVGLLAIFLIGLLRLHRSVEG